MQTIEQIDLQIDANRRVLMARVHCDPACSAQAWQNAWDRCPDLHARERALFVARGDAQAERDALAEKEYRKQRRTKRAA